MGCYKVILDCAEANIVFYEKCGLTRKEIQLVRDSVNASCPPFRSRIGYGYRYLLRYQYSASDQSLHCSPSTGEVP